ncbi:MAG TPA: hypothetical protein VIX81_11995 [Gammaproteobacteria bacterium]
MSWAEHGGGLLPHGEGLRRALRWIGEHGDHSTAALEEAARRFDLTPLEEAFLLQHFRLPPPGPAPADEA